MQEKESGIKFLEDKDLRRIRAIPNYSQITLVRGHILYQGGRYSESCEVIVARTTKEKRKIRAHVGVVIGAEGAEVIPAYIKSERAYSGSLAMGNLENDTLIRLRALYENGNISASQYDDYTRIVSTSREDQMGGYGPFLAHYIALVSAISAGYFNSGDLGSMFFYPGIGGATGTLVTAAAEKHTKKRLEDAVNSFLRRVKL